MIDVAKAADLAWLSGTWRGRMGDDVVEEIWSRPRGGCLAAVFRWIQADRIHLYEILSIEDEADGPVLRIRHFDPGLVGWRAEDEGPKAWLLKTLEARKVVFEDPQTAFPTRVVYERLDDRTLVARLEGRKASGAAELEFRFDLQDD